MFGHQWRCFDFRGLLSDDVGFVQTAGNIPLWTVSHSDFPLRGVSLCSREKPEWDVSHHFGLFKGRTKGHGGAKLLCVAIVLPSEQSTPTYKSRLSQHKALLVAASKNTGFSIWPFLPIFFCFYCCRSTNNPFAGYSSECGKYENNFSSEFWWPRHSGASR